MASNIPDPSSSSTEFLNMLVEMGFPKDIAERALEATKGHSVDAAIDWIVADENQAPVTKVEHVDVMATSDASELHKAEGAEEAEDKSELAKSVRCDECNKLFRCGSEVEFHAAKTGHTSFSESEEEIKPLTEEEKKEQVKKLEALIKQRRLEKEEQEKKEAIEKEKCRRKHGQELSEVRQRFEEQEMKRLAELKRREKLEARMARQKILEDIERDKQARRERFGLASTATSTVAPVPTAVTEALEPVESMKEYDSCRLQIRLTNGDSLIHTFSANEELAAVRLYIEMNRTDVSGPFSMMTSFPKKVFTEEDMCCPLKSLGLVPSAVIIVRKTL